MTASPANRRHWAARLQNHSEAVRFPLGTNGKNQGKAALSHQVLLELRIQKEHHFTIGDVAFQTGKAMDIGCMDIFL